MEQTLKRSTELHGAILKVLEDAVHDDSERVSACLTMSDITLEHAFSLRALFEVGAFTSGASLLRVQFESLTRAMWLFYAAHDNHLSKLTAPLSLETEHSAGNIPSLTKMIESISKKAPPLAGQMLTEFKENTWKAMNSFVHSGIHPMNRASEGYPLHLLIQLIQMSNALSTMVAMTMAVTTYDSHTANQMKSLQVRFKDCLPPLIR
ncbi:MAG: hypothetical protein V7739_03225 [Motiliproteus sp.]